MLNNNNNLLNFKKYLIIYFEIKVFLNEINWLSTIKAITEYHYKSLKIKTIKKIFSYFLIFSSFKLHFPIRMFLLIY